MRIEVRDVGKTYPNGHAALSRVSLTFDRGLFGLLGPNGAGKTTLMKIMTTLLPPSTGTVLVDGVDVASDRNLLRRTLGYLGQEWGAPRAARCEEVLELVLRLRGVEQARLRSEKIDYLLGLVGLAAFRRRKVKTLSGGMLRRLGVAQALAGDPALMVLDEPTVGLDPNERVSFRALLAHLGRSHTIVLSTHIVADVGNTCERVAVLDKGTVVFEGLPADLAAHANGKVFEIVTTADGEETLRANGLTVTSAVPTAEGSRLRVVGDRVAGFPLVAVEPTIEDAYLVLVGAEAAMEGAEKPVSGDEVAA